MKAKTLLNSFYRDGNPGKEPAELEDIVASARSFRRVLIRALKKDLERKVVEDESKKDYDSPNYHELKADRCGERRQIRRLIRILQEGIPHVRNEIEEEDGKETSGANAESS